MFPQLKQLWHAYKIWRLKRLLRRFIARHGETALRDGLIREGWTLVAEDSATQSWTLVLKQNEAVIGLWQHDNTAQGL
jgi:hypothetical protein